MNLLDLLLALIVGGSVVAGFVSGFARAGLSFFAAIAGVILGFWFYDLPAAWYVGMTGSQSVADLFGFFTVFLIVLGAGAFLGRVISKVFKWTGLGIVDRLLGAVFGLVRGSLVAAAAVAVLLAATPRPVPGWMVGSALLPYALGASNIASNLAPKVLKDALSNSVGEIRKAWAEEIEKAKRHALGQTDAPPKQELKIVEQPTPKPSPKKEAKTAPKKSKSPKSPPPRAVNQ
ncbi:MAG: CvpA family protein [Acidobacteriota bacterium]